MSFVLTIGSTWLSDDFVSSTNRYQCQSWAETAWSRDVYKHLDRYNRTYPSRGKRRKRCLRAEGRSHVVSTMPILSSSLVENESFASDIRASFHWKNIYSTAMERSLPILAAHSVFRGRVCAHQRSLSGFIANEKSQSAWSNEHGLGSPRVTLGVRYNVPQGMRWNVHPDTESGFAGRFLRAIYATDIMEKNVFASVCVLYIRKSLLARIDECRRARVSCNVYTHAHVWTCNFNIIGAEAVFGECFGEYVVSP